MFSKQFDSLTPIGSLCHQFEIRLIRDECRDAFAKEGVVVY
jgi:hypothetical protein